MFDVFYLCAQYRTWISSYYKRLHTHSAGYANAVLGAGETEKKYENYEARASVIDKKQSDL